jgi:putative PIN family toxin of toxin-antitoxin system
MNLFVIDAGIWVRLARSDYASPLIDRIVSYSLIPIVNNYLLSEIHDGLLKNQWATEKQANKFIFLVKNLSLFVIENVIYRVSPDAEDNYLFDLAIQHNAPFLISDDKALLAFPLKPVPVKSGNWCIKKFPV